MQTKRVNSTIGVLFNGSRWLHWVSPRWTVCHQSACNIHILPSASHRTWSSLRASLCSTDSATGQSWCRHKTQTPQTQGSRSASARQSSGTELCSCSGLRRSWWTSRYDRWSDNNHVQNRLIDWLTQQFFFCVSFFPLSTLVRCVCVTSHCIVQCLFCFFLFLMLQCVCHCFY